MSPEEQIAERRRVGFEIAELDALIVDYSGIVKGMDKPNPTDEMKSLFETATVELRTLEFKRAELIRYLKEYVK